MSSKRLSEESDPTGRVEKRRRLSTPSFDEPSDSALLYYNAHAAHIASVALLQQVFIPHHVQVTESDTIEPIPVYATGKPYKHDLRAAEKVLALQIHALDCLRIGLKSGMLSIGEKAAFTVEFATIGIKVLESTQAARMEGKQRVERDVLAAVNEMVSDLCLEDGRVPSEGTSNRAGHQ